MFGAAEGIAGLTLSAVSIAALFTTCIDCYSLVVAAREFGEEYELLCTELSLQKLGFFLWGESVGLACRTPDAQLQPNPGLDDPHIQPTIIRTLNAIKNLLSETQEFDERYGFRAEEAAVGTTSRGLSIFRRTFDQFKSQARRNQKQKSVVTVTRWAIFDADNFEVKIARLKGFIDGLESVTRSLVTLEAQRARLEDEIESVSDVQSLRLLSEVADVSDTASRRLNYVELAAAADIMSLTSRPATSASNQTFISAMSHFGNDNELLEERAEFNPRTKIQETADDHGISPQLLFSTSPLTKPSEASTNTSSRRALTGDNWLISTLRYQFPPDHHMKCRWDFKKYPEFGLRKSYKDGLAALNEVDRSAPIIQIGITFKAGDNISATMAEMSKISDMYSDQKTPAWRVFTSANLLRLFRIADDLSHIHRDRPATDMGLYKRGKDGSRYQDSRSPSYLQGSGPYRSALLNPYPKERNSRAFVKRNIQKHNLTIDSNYVRLLHGNQRSNQGFDFTCTLVEVDLLSMRELVTNFRAIAQSEQHNLSAQQILRILDTMIIDVRRLCTRNPQLFRMSTRALIAQSEHIRYGVDYSNCFATLTTSEGMRHLIRRSTAYFASLDNSKIDQEEIRPRFLQMLVLLLSFLNNHDLAMITDVLERASMWHSGLF